MIRVSQSDICSYKGGSVVTFSDHVYIIAGLFLFQKHRKQAVKVAYVYYDIQVVINRAGEIVARRRGKQAELLLVQNTRG